ncbi:hypothetical protein BH11PLA2_BH11PLA2_23430 [soil metagenome]
MAGMNTKLAETATVLILGLNPKEGIVITAPGLVGRGAFGIGQ